MPCVSSTWNSNSRDSSPTNRERAERGQTSTLSGIGANVALVIGKVTAGVVGHLYGPYRRSY
jgi:hypothetical protein